MFDLEAGLQDYSTSSYGNPLGASIELLGKQQLYAFSNSAWHADCT